MLIYNIRKESKETAYSSDATIKKLDIEFKETRLSHVVSSKDTSNRRNILTSENSVLYAVDFIKDGTVVCRNGIPSAINDQEKIQYPEKIYVLIYKDEELPEIFLAEANDEKAQVEIIQPTEDTHQGEIRVTAENGEEKAYQIIVKRIDTTINNALIEKNKLIKRLEKMAEESKRFPF